jgi:hypothetical protein
MAATLAPLSVKLQGWGDDLRLPTVMEPATIIGLIESLRRPSIPLQSKHLPALKRNVWFALQRPADKSRTGLLCVLPREQCCVYVSGEPPSHKRPTPRVGLLRLRVDPQFFAADAGPTVFAATLSAASRKLSVEDVILWKGRAVGEEEPFRKRWELASQWLGYYCVIDSRLMGGLEVEMANWQALDDIKPNGVWDMIQDQTGYRRLLWIYKKDDGVTELPATELPATELPAVPTVVTVQTAPTTVDGTRTVIAVKESGPDQWSLKSEDGVSLGRALIRTLDVSTALRSVSSGEPRVKVVWNTAFKKWEIVEFLRHSSGI